MGQDERVQNWYILHNSDIPLGKIPLSFVKNGVCGKKCINRFVHSRTATEFRKIKRAKKTTLFSYILHWCVWKWPAGCR